MVVINVQILVVFCLEIDRYYNNIILGKIVKWGMLNYLKYLKLFYSQFCFIMILLEIMILYLILWIYNYIFCIILGIILVINLDIFIVIMVIG